MSNREKVLILDFGSQYSQLIARRIRELGVYCEIVPHDMDPDEVRRIEPKGIVLSGGPASVYQPDAPAIDRRILELQAPILGICYGMQLLAELLGGKVARHGGCEYGPATLEVHEADGLFTGLGDRLEVWASHGDRVIRMPEGFSILAGTSDCRIAAFGEPVRGIYGVQFHPEVVHTPRGKEVLSNFLFKIAGCEGGWTMANFIEEATKNIRQQVGDKHVLCGLSGGVDSSVVAVLLSRAIGEKTTAVFVDNGLLRAGEAEQVQEYFQTGYSFRFHFVDAGSEFVSALARVEDPERKRKIIGKTFIDVFRREAGKLGKFAFLAQGTLYPDVIESSSAHGGPSVTIKTHHNVGGLPEELGFELIEPLRELFKDEVRLLGSELGLADHLINRQPFPGPGLAVRIIGAVTQEQLGVLREADLIVQDEIGRYEDYDGIWQAFAVLLPVKSVGVMGDERTYDNAIAVRVVTSMDGMTADWARLPHELLAKLSSRVINEVDGVNRVVYDISSKPPSTIEWE